MCRTCLLCFIPTLILVYLITQVQSQSTNESCYELYEKGIEAYLENDYKTCVSKLEKAIAKQRKYKKFLQTCRIKCKANVEQSEPLYPVNVDNLLFFERSIKQTLCIVECQKEDPEIFNNINNQQVDLFFEERRPYEYLQICYFQLKEYMKAANSAFTYLVSNPEDKAMRANLKHYSSLNEVNMNEIVNYEALDHVYLYSYGVQAYESKNWKDAIDNLENSLEAYFAADNECRASCEGPFDQGWFPDFLPSVSNHFTFCLKCKQKCKDKLALVNGEVDNDLLPNHYHYLQFSYFKMGDLKKACECVASYLAFYPKDQVMLSNLEYYSALPKYQKDFLQPREEAVHYVQREMYENLILKYIRTDFKIKTKLALSQIAQ